MGTQMKLFFYFFIFLFKLLHAFLREHVTLTFSSAIVETPESDAGGGLHYQMSFGFLSGILASLLGCDLKEMSNVIAQ